MPGVDPCFVMHYSKWIVHINKPIGGIRVDISLPNIQMIMDNFILSLMDGYSKSLMDFRKEVYFSILHAFGELLFMQDDKKGHFIIDLIAKIIQNDGTVGYEELLDACDGDLCCQQCALLSAHR